MAPADRQLAIESHERLAVQLADVHGLPAGEPVRGMDGQDHDLFPPGDDRQLRPLPGIGDQPEVGLSPATRSTTRVGCRYSSRTLASG